MAATLAASAIPSPAEAQSRDVLVIANQGDNSVHLVEAATGRNLAVIPTSPAPHEVAVSRDGRWAVVTNYVTPGSPPGHTLQVIDVPALKVARVIELGRYLAPHDVEFLPGDTMLAVTSEATKNIVLVDFASGEVKGALATNAQGSHMIAFTGDGRRIFSANVHGGTATELDVAGARVVRTYDVGPGSEGLALTPDGKQLWVASLGQSSTMVFDTETGEKIATLATPGHPYRITITPDGRKALIPAPMQNLLRVIDVATRAEETIAVPGGPGGAVVAADGRTVYLPLVEAGGVAVVDLQSKRVLRTLPSGAGPDGIGIARIGG
jgi:YVTN family beta-propeller protein